MADEPEDLTIHLLRKIGGEMQAIRSDLQDLRSAVKDLRQRIDGNTLILDRIAGVVHGHKHRIERLEQPTD